MRFPLMFKVFLSLYIPHTHAFRFSDDMKVHRLLTPKDIYKTLEKVYQKNPALKENLHAMTDSDIRSLAKEISSHIESFYSPRSLSSTTPRYYVHKKQLIALLKKDQECAQAEWIKTHPIVEQKDFSAPASFLPEGALDLLLSEATQRYPQNQIFYEKWKNILPLLKESDQAKKKDLQYEIAHAIEESQEHRRHILQERLGQGAHTHESDLLGKATSLASVDNISLQELRELLDVFFSLTHHNHVLADRLSKMGDHAPSHFSDTLAHHDGDIDKGTLFQIHDKLNKIASYQHVLNSESRPIYEALCTLAALNLLLDSSFPLEKIRARLDVVQHLPQWDSEQVQEFLAPGNVTELTQWEDQIARLEEKLKELLVQPDRYKDVMVYFSSAYPEKFQKVEARIAPCKTDTESISGATEDPSDSGSIL
jgi:hypothetical protein